MGLIGFLFGRWSSKRPLETRSEPVTLHPTPSPRAYRSPHSKPFRPQPQGEAETRGWLSDPTPTAVNSIVRTRDRAGYLVGTAQRTHAAEETRRWLRAPTDGNLRRILQQRDDARGAPVLTSPSFPSLKQMVTDAGVELASTTSGCSSVGVRETVAREPVASPTNAHFEHLDEDLILDPEIYSRVETQLGRRPRSRYHAPMGHGLGLQPPAVRPPQVPQPPGEEHRGRSRFRSSRMDWGELKRRYEMDELPPRPSRFPSHYDEEDGCSDAEIRTAMDGRVTRSQRTFSVSRPQPVPAEYLSWVLASDEAFADGELSDEDDYGGDAEDDPAVEFSDEGDDEDYIEDNNAVQPEPESEPEDIPPHRSQARSYFSDSDSSLSRYSDVDDNVPEEFRLQELSRAFALPLDTPRRTLEAFLYRNPSALYHILTATVPHPRLEGLFSSHLDSLAKGRLERHIRKVKWALINMAYVDWKERFMKKGPRVQRKVLGRPRRLREIDGMGDYVREVRTRGMVPSKLRYCETAE